ncbi:hypothetical protein HDU87_003814 [Geranomyces variabilis]|uniref:Uncharacterized protein n=1 Tax=Geranomyces variabilis TaxID=109894 RepID=A0AAD5XQZ3_9FUNG|nr:hypothetical protein HDU87_003814 [Geranomyces variabilis]
MSVGAPPTGPVKFEWDCDIPATPFWSDLEYTIGRNFIECYTKAELNAMTFPEDLSKAEKRNLLLGRLQDTLDKRTAAVAPKPLWEADLSGWNDLLLGIYTINSELGRLDVCEGLLDQLATHGTFNLKMSVKKMLSTIRERQGNYADAEKLARECVAFLDELPMLGPDSPQALSNLRSIIRPVWKQGRRDVARALAKKHEAMVDAMSNEPQSRFVQYQEDERGYLRELMEELEKWDKDNKK